MKGLEPPRLAAPDPKSGAATNYATSAGSFKKDCKIRCINTKKQEKYADNSICLLFKELKLKGTTLIMCLFECE
jgi:hypothetical protein